MKKGKSLYITLMGYFVMVLIIPCIVIMILCVLGTYLVQKQVFTANQIIVEQVESEITNRLSTFQRYNITTQQKQDMRNIRFEKGYLPTRLRYNLVQTIETLGEVILADPYVSDYMIYLPEQMIIYGKGYSYLSSYSQDKTKQYLGYQVNWKDFLSKPHYSELLTVYKDKQMKAIYYIDTMNGSYFKNKGYQFILRLNKTHWDEQIETMLDHEKQSVIAIFNKTSNEMVYTNHPEFFETLDDIKSNDYSENGYLSINNKNDYYSFMTESEKFPLKFVLIENVSSIEKATKWMKVLIIICLVGTILSSFIILHILKLKEYNSIAMTMALVGDEPFNQKNTTVFGAVQSIVGKLITEKQTLQNSLEDSLEYLQKYFLVRMLNQEITEQDNYRSLLLSYQISFPYEKIRLMLISGVSQENVTSWTEKYQTVKDMVISTMDHKYAGAYKVYPVLQHGMLQVILNYNLKPEAAETMIDQLCNFRKYLESESLIVALSREKESCFSLYEASKETAEVMEQCLLENVSFKEYQHHRLLACTKQAKYYQYESNLKRALSECNYNNAEILIHNMFILLRDSFSTNITDVKCKLFGVMNILEENAVNSGNEEQVDYICEKLDGEVTIKNIKKSIREILEFLKQQNQKIETKDFSSDIERFIQDNYQSGNLSVGMIADSFQVEFTVLSKRFKKERGMNLSDYIHLVRLNKAKELLADPNVTIKWIAKQCGYINSDVFIKVFKRYEGLTPGKYRSNLFPDRPNT